MKDILNGKPNFNGCGLAKAERLCGRSSFLFLFTKGKKLKSDWFRVVFYWFLRQENAPPAIVAVAVPRKIIKKAVVRNSIKRKVKSAWQSIKPDLYAKIPKNYKLQMVLISNGKMATFHEIVKDITRFFSKILASLPNES